MKAESKNYKGIAYVQVSELPQSQQERLLHVVNPNLFIKIMIDGKIIGECLQYKDYCAWFDSEFCPRIVPVKEIVVRETVEINPNLALNKL